MSNMLFGGIGFAVSAYTGPARIDGGSRKRYQIANVETAQWVTLSAEQWKALKAWMVNPPGCPCPFCREEMIAAYEAGRDAEHVSRETIPLTRAELGEDWYQRVHGDSEGPYCREEMIAAYGAGRDAEHVSRETIASRETLNPDQAR